jgi:excisionase family DNA binding protein
MVERRPLASPKQVGQHLGVAVQTLYDWRHRGTGPRAVRVGKHQRYRWEDVDTWLTEQDRTGGAA